MVVKVKHGDVPVWKNVFLSLIVPTVNAKNELTAGKFYLLIVRMGRHFRLSAMESVEQLIISRYYTRDSAFGDSQ